MAMNQYRHLFRYHSWLAAFVAILVVFLCSASYAAQDPLPSWNEGSAKTAILKFVAAVTDEKSKDYVEPAERIAVFDHDGTCFCY